MLNVGFYKAIRQ